MLNVIEIASQLLEWNWLTQAQYEIRLEAWKHFPCRPHSRPEDAIAAQSQISVAKLRRAKAGLPPIPDAEWTRPRTPDPQWVDEQASRIRRRGDEAIHALIEESLPDRQHRTGC